MSIKKLQGTITNITDLSKTAKDVTITLNEDLGFIPGSFINLFMDINGAKVRRAFSISSSDKDQKHIAVSIRESLNGTMSPVFWTHDQTGTQVELMGPLGLNTGDKMHSEKVYLFAFGVGAGVVKSLLDHFATKKEVTKIEVMTGSRSEDEILHKEYFDTMAQTHPHIEVRHVVSQPAVLGIFREGYIQDHIGGIDFNNTDVYTCGQEVACDGLVAKIKEQNPVNCNFFIEAFH